MSNKKTFNYIACIVYLKIMVIVINLLPHHVFANNQEKKEIAPDVLATMRLDIMNSIKPRLVFTSQEKANAWLSDMSNRLKKFISDDSLRRDYLTIIHYEASRAGLDPQLILSIIEVESGFNKYSISKQGALGMMQIMPFWVDAIGISSHNLFNVTTNIRYGCAILRYYIEKEHGNLSRALARYNGKLGSIIYPELVFSTYKRAWTPYPLVTLKNDETITINYIEP